MAGDRLRVICGPTAAGKSAIALALAERSRALIVSADSRQIYRGFDIGTAKPTDEERGRVPHRGIDVAEPTERFSAAAWASAAEVWLRESEAADRIPIIVGGTGFYIRALTAPLFAEPYLDPERRRALAAKLAPNETSELRRWCTVLDRARARLGRAQLLRAIEVALLTGVPLSVWHERSARPLRVQARYLVIDPGAVLARLIADRVHAMIATGWEDEVESLMATVPEDAPAWNATGYRIVRDRVHGALTRAAATERIIIETRQFAKRQRTWFRHQLPRADVTLLDPTQPRAREQALVWSRCGESA